MHQNDRPTSLRKAVLTSAFLALSVSAGSAQTTEPSATRAQPDFDGALRALGIDLPPVDDRSQRLSSCLQPLFDDAPEHAEIMMAMEIDADGRPIDTFLVEPQPDTATQAHLRQLFRAEAALYDCAPIDITVERTASTDPAAPVVLSLRVTANQIIALAPDAPRAEPPSAPAFETDERALALSRQDRRQIQIRLRLAGHDPGGADGVLGPRSRAAIEAWQRASGHPATGYVNETQVSELEAETEADFEAWAAAQPARPSYYRGRDGCLRDSRGRIVAGRSLGCDMRGLLNRF